MQGSYTVIKLLCDVHTAKGVFKTGEVHKLTGTGYSFTALEIGPDHYHCLYEGMYEIVKEYKAPSKKI